MVLRAAKALGIEVCIRSGQMYYNLGDFWRGGEDSIVDDNGKYVIGRATDIMAPFLELERYTLNGDN